MGYCFSDDKWDRLVSDDEEDMFGEGEWRDHDPRERTCPPCGGNGCDECEHTGAVPLRVASDEKENMMNPNPGNEVA